MAEFKLNYPNYQKKVPRKIPSDSEDSEEEEYIDEEEHIDEEYTDEEKKK